MRDDFSDSEEDRGKFTRRKFLKKIGVGAAGAGAFSFLGSSFRIDSSTGLDYFSSSGRDFGVNSSGFVEASQIGDKNSKVSNGFFERVVSRTNSADAVVYQEGGTAYAVGQSEIIDSGQKGSEVLESALNYNKRGSVELASDVEIYSTVEVPGSINIYGRGHNIVSNTSGYALYHHPPSDNIGEMIGHNSVLSGFKVECADGENGIKCEDVTSTHYKDLEVHNARVGWLVQDRNYWVEESVWTNCRAKGYSEAGMRIGSSAFDCRFENLALGTDVDNTVALDLTNETPYSGDEGYDARQTVFDNLMMWTFTAPNPETCTALRVDTYCNDLHFRKPQVHPARGTVSIHFTSDASGSMTLDYPIMGNTVKEESGADINIVQKPQTILDPEVGMVEDFGSNHLSKQRNGARTWDEDNSMPVQYRPRWERVSNSIVYESGKVTVPAGENGPKSPVIFRDTDYSWEITLRYNSEPSSGRFRWDLFQEPNSLYEGQQGNKITLFWYAGGKVTVEENDGSGWSQILDAGQHLPDTSEHVLRVERSPGGSYEVIIDGTSQKTGSSIVSLSGRQLNQNIGNRTDVELDLIELKYNL